MPKIVTDARDFTADRAWGARDLAAIEGASVRLHWTDQPYKWHVNDGAEVFLVLDGEVEMRWREDGAEHLVRLGPPTCSSLTSATSMWPTRSARPAS